VLALSNWLESNRTPEQPAPTLHVHISHPEAIVNAGLAALLLHCPNVRLTQGAPGCHAGVDVVITDYVDAMRRLPRAIDSGERVMIVSERELEWDVRTALAAGVHGYLPQRCEAVELQAALRTLGRGQRYFNQELLARATQNLAVGSLTSRESQVLALLATGCCNKQIALTLDIGVGTVKTHVKALFCKLNAKTRTHAVMLAAQRGLVSHRNGMHTQASVPRPSEQNAPDRPVRPWDTGGHRPAGSMDVDDHP
jgi:two-component system NarL family response regulator